VSVTLQSTASSAVGQIAHRSQQETQLVSLASKLSSTYRVVVRTDKQNYSTRITVQPAKLATAAVLLSLVNPSPHLRGTLAAIHPHIRWKVARNNVNYRKTLFSASRIFSQRCVASLRHYTPRRYQLC